MYSLSYVTCLLSANPNWINFDLHRNGPIQSVGVAGLKMPKREGNTDHFSVDSTFLDDDNNHEVIKFTPPDDRGNRAADHHRDVTSEYLKNMPFDSMPGFRFSWFYSDKELIPDASYRNEKKTVLFVR